MALTLICETSTGKTIEPRSFEAGTVGLGRAPGNDFVLAMESHGVSGNHARFEFKDGTWYLTDIGSTNGTRLNGQPLVAHQANVIQNGDVVFIGHWKIVCKLGAAQAGPAPTSAPTAAPAPIPAPVVVPKIGPAGTASALPIPTMVPAAGETTAKIEPASGPAAPLDLDIDRDEVRKVAFVLREVLNQGGDLAGNLRDQLRKSLAKLPTSQHLDLLEQLEEIATKQAAGGGGAAAKVLEAVEAERVRQRSLREAAFTAMSELSKERANTDASFRDHGDVQRFFTLIDNSLDLTLEWIVSCLSGRRAFEEKFGAKVTKFFGLERNPIKHALSAPQAGAYLLGWEHDRNTAEIKANLEDAFRDLTAHQLALVAGVQALKAALAHLDPATHEKAARDKASAFSKALGLSVDKEAWIHLKKTYQELFDNESKLFNEVIFPNVRQGYLAAHDEHGLGKSSDGG
jgi:type VI secretion system protein